MAFPLPRRKITRRKSKILKSTRRVYNRKTRRMVPRAYALQFIQKAVCIEDFFKKRGVQGGGQAFAGQAVLGRMSLQQAPKLTCGAAQVGCPWRCFTRLPSSPNVTSSCQCNWFSMPQCPRTAWAKALTLRSRLLM